MFAAGEPARPPDPYPPSSRAPSVASSCCICACANWRVAAASALFSRAWSRRFRFASDRPVAC